MVKANICGMCKHYIGLSDDKCNMLCDAFPDGIEIDASTVKACTSDYSFEPKDELKDLCSKEVFKKKFA